MKLKSWIILIVVLLFVIPTYIALVNQNSAAQPNYTNEEWELLKENGGAYNDVIIKMKELGCDTLNPPVECTFYIHKEQELIRQQQEIIYDYEIIINNYQ